MLFNKSQQIEPVNARSQLLHWHWRHNIIIVTLCGYSLLRACYIGIGTGDNWLAIQELLGCRCIRRGLNTNKQLPRNTNSDGKHIALRRFQTQFNQSTIIDIII